MIEIHSQKSLEQLIETPEPQRDAHWESHFFHKLTSGSLEVLSPDPQTGPDGWPYLLTQISPHATEPSQKVIQWLASKGMGLVVNPHKEYPDFVFTYGMIWHFRETGLFYKSIEKNPVNGSVNIEVGSNLQVGFPDEKFLPSYVRQILREFFRDQGLHDVRVLLISENPQHFDLAFSLESMGNPPEQEHQGILEAISWFLPPQYSLLLISQKNLPEFQSL